MNSDDQKIQKISRMLELGGTMLAEHCQICGAPKFRYHGQVICPVCDFSEQQPPQQARPEPAPEPVAESALKEEPEPVVPEKVPVQRTAKRAAEKAVDMVSVEELMFKKITAIGQQMQDETDPRRIEESFELIEKGLSIIERLKGIE